ncbi:MAG: phosphatidylserine decarboxylase [Clostridia bacterium]|nr:phosphatidylserine decarboxylase [Clostridia bacterium]
MKIKHRIYTALLAVLLMLSVSGCKKEDESQGAATLHEPITQELIAILEENPQTKALLEKSIEMAKEINPDKATNPAQTLEEYYDYVDWAAKAMPWNISKSVEGTSLYKRIDQSLNYFYFINDMPLEELDGEGLYNNSLQYAEPYRTWLINFTKDWGKYLDSNESWNDEYHDMIYEDELFGLQNEWYEDKSNWESFNDFFARHLKSPDVRPIAAKDNNAVITSPADSTPQGVWEIDENSQIVQKEGALIKSQKFNSVADLIGPKSEYRNSFARGTLTHTFLDVYDYHRYHFPIGGTIKEITLIDQDDAVGGEVTWDEESKQYILNAETPGWQMIETRGCVILDTEEYGLVALLPIGMSQVSSVNFEKELKVGSVVSKGDMLGYFLFGGSDFVMIFQQEAQFEITAPQQRGEEGFEHIYMGEEYGRLKK